MLAPRACGTGGAKVACVHGTRRGHASLGCTGSDSGRQPFAPLYPETVAVLGEADLLQPRLDLGLLPAGHAGQDGPRHLLAQQAQRALGQR